MSKLATPKPASAIRSDMSHVIDDATSAMHDTYDETVSMSDTIVPLSEFLDEQIARAREKEIIACGGGIGIANDSIIKNGTLQKLLLPVR